MLFRSTYGVIAHLSQLHQYVQQSVSIGTTEFVQFGDIFSQTVHIPLLLHFGQANVQLGLFLRGQGCRYIFFHATELKQTKSKQQIVSIFGSHSSLTLSFLQNVP